MPIHINYIDNSFPQQEKNLLRMPYHNSYIDTVSHQCVASSELEDQLLFKMSIHINCIDESFLQQENNL